LGEKALRQSPASSLDRFIEDGQGSTDPDQLGVLPHLIAEPSRSSLSSPLFATYLMTAIDTLCLTLAQRDGELAETKAALRVLQRQQEEDRRKWEETVGINMRTTILPLIEKLKRSPSGDQILHLANLLEECIETITEPFIRDFSSLQTGMTPREIQIAVLIRQGKNSKDISDLIGVSLGTVNTHRNNIRKKLHLKNKDISLQSYLLSLV
jgi:DNA-binding CsgD family transcriptional regulator